MKFRKKPVVVEATRWFKNGDHPEDGCGTTTAVTHGSYQGEGKVVRYFRDPETFDDDECEYCQQIMKVHGWIDTLEGGHIVCPGDWVITGIVGERYPCKDSIFKKTYEPVE